MKKNSTPQKRLCRVCRCDVTALWPQVICNKKSCAVAWKEDKRIRANAQHRKYAKKTKLSRRQPRKKCEICGRKQKLTDDGRAYTCARQSCKDAWEKKLKTRKRKREQNVVFSRKKNRQEKKLAKEKLTKEKLSKQKLAKQKLIRQKLIKQKLAKEKLIKQKLNEKALLFNKDHEDYFDDDMFREEQKEYHKSNGRFCHDCGKALWGNFYKRCPKCAKVRIRGISDLDVSAPAILHF